MPRSEYKTCRECGQHTSVVGPLSHTRLCAADSERLALANNREIARRDGPFFEHWRRRHYMAAVRLLLDDVRDAGQA